MDCEVWIPPMPTTAASTEGHSRSATPATTRERYGLGCSAPSSRRTCGFTAIRNDVWRFSNRCPNIFWQPGWAALAKSSMAIRRLCPAEHLRRPGAWPKSCARGGLVMTRGCGQKRWPGDGLHSALLRWLCLFRRLDELDQQFAILCDRHEEEVHQRLIRARPNLWIHRLELESLTKDFPSAGDIAHVTLD